jgi:hypothetical protein
VIGVDADENERRQLRQLTRNDGLDGDDLHCTERSFTV